MLRNFISNKLNPWNSPPNPQFFIASFHKKIANFYGNVTLVPAQLTKTTVYMFFIESC